MSGMISERSANRGSCAQSCRKDYVLTDAANGAELDRGYLISAKDLGGARASRRHRRRGHRLPQGRRAKEEARVRRDGHEDLPRFPRPRRTGRRHARLAGGSRNRSCRSSAADSPAACTAGARGATTSRARSRTIAASSSAWSSDSERGELLVEVIAHSQSRRRTRLRSARLARRTDDGIHRGSGAHARTRGTSMRQAIEPRVRVPRRLAGRSHVGGRAPRAGAGELRVAAARGPRQAQSRLDVRLFGALGAAQGGVHVERRDR